MLLNFIQKLFILLKSSSLSQKEPKQNDKNTLKNGSKVYALERLKEIHNYDYSSFIANYYRNKNHIIWEYSKEKNLVNHELNLVMKREKNIMLIQCRSNISEITLDNIFAFERRGVEFIEQYKLFKNYNILYLFTCSEYGFSEGALEYISNNNHISYKVLKEFES